jgi:hypothetical protein
MVMDVSKLAADVGGVYKKGFTFSAYIGSRIDLEQGESLRTPNVLTHRCFFLATSFSPAVAIWAYNAQVA